MNVSFMSLYAKDTKLVKTRGSIDPCFHVKWASVIVLVLFYFEFWIFW